jgi:hypothetical protein
MNWLHLPRFKAQDNNNKKTTTTTTIIITIDAKLAMTNMSLRHLNQYTFQVTKTFSKFFLISLMKQQFALTQQYTILQETVETRHIFNCQRRKHIMCLRKYK